VAIPSYPLAPAARITAIGAAAAAAVAAAAARVRGPVVLAGHSAGGQLAARAAAPGRGPDLGGRLVRVVAVSPLSDLRPLLRTALNGDLRLDPAEARAESPALMPPPPAPVHVWVGADERPAFRDQARWLAQAWGARLTVEPGRHHFDVIEGLADPGSPLTRAVTGEDL
jgi:acetyl esterase/lipase